MAYSMICISGPMAGKPNLNYGAFNKMADDLRAKGYAVQNPADNPAPENPIKGA